MKKCILGILISVIWIVVLGAVIIIPLFILGGKNKQGNNKDVIFINGTPFEIKRKIVNKSPKEAIDLLSKQLEQKGYVNIPSNDGIKKVSKLKGSYCRYNYVNLFGLLYNKENEVYLALAFPAKPKTSLLTTGKLIKNYKYEGNNKFKQEVLFPQSEVLFDINHKNSIMLYQKISLDIDDVESYYLTQLPKSGWVLDEKATKAISKNVEDTDVMNFNKKGYLLYITCRSDGDVVYVASVLKKSANLGD